MGFLYGTHHESYAVLDANNMLALFFGISHGLICPTAFMLDVANHEICPVNHFPVTNLHGCFGVSNGCLVGYL